MDSRAHLATAHELYNNERHILAGNHLQQALDGKYMMSYDGCDQMIHGTLGLDDHDQFR